MNGYSTLLLAGAVALAAGLPARAAHAEIFLDLGGNTTRIESRIANRDDAVSETESGLHFGVGARRGVGERSDLSVRLELDNLGSDLLLAVRAFDYRYHLSERLAVNAFLGAARLDLATPAYGYYAGGGLQVKQLFEGWDLSLDLRFGEKVARDNLLPSDPQGGSPDNFHDITSIGVYFSFGF